MFKLSKWNKFNLSFLTKARLLNFKLNYKQLRISLATKKTNNKFVIILLLPERFLKNILVYILTRYIPKYHKTV